jgi:hypothetical protein
MKRFEEWASWFFTCLGVVMVAASILVVPQEAFAYSGECASCASSPDPAACGGSWASSNCGDQSCVISCCLDACAMDPMCYSNCDVQGSLVNCAAERCKKDGGCHPDCAGQLCSTKNTRCVSNTKGCICPP